jgi:S-adenosylmethionine uptake transporter
MATSENAAGIAANPAPWSMAGMNATTPPPSRPPGESAGETAAGKAAATTAAPTAAGPTAAPTAAPTAGAAAGLAAAPPVLVALTAILMGCVLDAFVKHLAMTYTAVLVAAGRYAFGTVVSGAALLAARHPLPPPPVLKAHAIRTVATTASAVLLFHAFSILPLAEATVIVFCAPLLIAPLARWLLGEQLRRMAVAALAVGFVGVLVTVQGAPLDAAGGRRLEGILAGLAASALYALSIVLLRQVAQRDSALMTAFLGNLFPAVYLILPAAFLGVVPTAADLPWFAATGLFGFLLWFFLSRAYGRASAQTLAVTEYTALIWSALFGFVFFHETPRWEVGAGAVIICGAVAFATWDGARTKRAAAAASGIVNP